MKTDSNYFKSLMGTYKNAPCKVLTYPLWKAEMRLDIEKVNMIQLMETYRPYMVQMEMD